MSPDVATVAVRATVLAAVGAEASLAPWRSGFPPGSASVRDFILPAVVTPADTTEHDAYERGVASGRRQATEAASAAIAAKLASLAAAIDEVTALRTEFLRRSEQDVVRLALEIAHRVIQREASSDPALLLGVARAAVEKVAASGLVTIEMNPADLAAAMPDGPPAVDGPVRIVSTPHLAPGACIVRSAAGSVDVSVAAQVQELVDCLLGNDAQR